MAESAIKIKYCGIREDGGGRAYRGLVLRVRKASPGSGRGFRLRGFTPTPGMPGRLF